MKKFLNDCHVNVLELAWLTDEQIDLFKSDFRFIARQLKNERTGKNLIPSDDRINHPDALLKLMGAITGDERFTEAVNNLREFQEGDILTMKRVRNFIDFYVEEGEARGRAIGEESARKSILQNLLAEGMPIEQALRIVGLTKTALN